jgi:hypothetical protein
MLGRHDRRVGADLAQRPNDVPGALGCTSLALEDEDAHRFVDRREVTVENLLDVVCLGGNVHALPQLEGRLTRSRKVAAGADDGEPLVVGDGERLLDQNALDRGRQRRDVLAAQDGERRDRRRVARRVAVGLLHLGRHDEHLVGDLRKRALFLAGDEPDRPRERPHGLERHRRPAFVADDNEKIGLRGREHGLERLDRLAAGLRRVKRGAAAGEDDSALRQPAVADTRGDAPEPLGLGDDRLTGELAGH